MDQWVLPHGFENFLIIPALSVPQDCFIPFLKFCDTQIVARRRLYYYEEGSIICFDPLGRFLQMTTDFFLNTEDVTGDEFGREFSLSRRPVNYPAIQYQAFLIEGPRVSRPFVQVTIDAGQTLVTNGYCTWEGGERIRLTEREERHGRNKQKTRHIDEYIFASLKARGMYYGIQVVKDSANRNRTRFECVVVLEVDITNYDGVPDVFYVHAERKILPFPPSETRSQFSSCDFAPRDRSLLERAIQRHKFCFDPHKKPIAF